MDPRLKERLIGAAVLVAAGVVVVPWVLDGPETVPPPEDTALESAADPTVPLRTETIELFRRDEPPMPAAAPANGTGANASAQAARPIPPPAAAPKGETARAEPLAEPPAHDTPDDTPGAVSEDAPADAPARTAASADAPPARPAAEPPAAAEPAAVADDHWTVQLGAFGEEENARRLADRVATYGFETDVSTYRSGGREMYRVRTRPVETRGRAEATASSLSAHGFVAQVVSAN